MKCLKCLNTIPFKHQTLNVNEHLKHFESWSICDDCDKKNKVVLVMYSSEYYQKNKEHYRELHKEYKKNLTDSYVANMIADRTTLKAKDIPKELIKAKRQHVQVKRILKEQNDDNDK